MLTYPRTIEEARKYRYGARAGIHAGNAYADGYCAYEVGAYAQWPIAHQCSRKSGHGPGGLYCKQHAKMVTV